MNGYRVPLDELRFPFLRPIYEAIEALGIPATRFCESIGYSSNMLSHWRCNVNAPNIRHVLDVCDALGLELIIRKKS